MITADKFNREIFDEKILSTGIDPLDKLLGGGIQRGMVYLFVVDSNFNSRLLHNIAFNATYDQICHTGECTKGVIYVEALNQFDPHFFSKQAVRHNVNPRAILRNIHLARTFTWPQVVETLNENLDKLYYNLQKSDESCDVIDTLIVSGLTNFFEEMTGDGKNAVFNFHPFQDLKKIFNGIRRLQLKCKIHVILTAKLNSKSNYRPAGGRLLSHFANIIVRIVPFYNGFEFFLDQHPYLANHSVRLIDHSILRKPKTRNLINGGNWGKNKKKIQQKAGLKKKESTLDNFMR